MRKEGVSPVVGIILLTAVTVALVSLAAFFVFDIGSSSSSGVGTATVNAEYESESRIDVRLLKQGSSDKVIVRSSLGTEYILDNTGEEVTILNQEGNQTPIVLAEKDGDRTVLRSVSPRSFEPDIIVSDGPQGQYEKIQPAVDAAAEGDIVVIQKNVYYENIDISTQNITLVGEEGTVIANNDSSTSVVDIQASGIRVSNIKVNASSSNGGTAAKYGVKSDYSTDFVQGEIANAETATTDNVNQFSSAELVSVNRIQADSLDPIPTTISQEWVETYDDTGGRDLGRNLAITTDENIVVAGYSTNNSNKDYYTIKYSSNGSEIWSRRYDSGNNDYGLDVAVDDNNNVIVTGNSENGTSQDYYTIKYSSNGSKLWSRRYDSGNSDSAFGVVADSNNNIIVTGYIDNGSNNDYYTIKYSSNGSKLWSKQYNSGNGDLARGIAVDNNNNVIITGFSYLNGDNDYYTVKYSSTGSQLWSARYDGDGRSDRGFDVAVDTDNNVIVTGDSNRTSGTQRDYYTIKYSSTGSQLWSARHDSGTDDRARNVAVDRENSIYVTGQSNDRAYTIKYNSTGEEEWNETYSNTVSFGLGLTVTQDGTTYVGGFIDTGNADYLVVKYN